MLQPSLASTNGGTMNNLELTTAPAEAITEEYRPAFHFTPHKNWINDPNGLVYYEGEYHLFYQYNPHGKLWGHMSWGHAVSSDLIHWEELPVAMPEREFMIFSGSVVVDWENSSGLGDGSEPPLIAVYTAYHQGPERQSQHVAYSHDRGRTWSEYSGNPVICLKQEHFRDPKVFWHAASGAWIMVVALPREHKAQIYRSNDLLSWHLASEFGPAGSVTGQWECPDLFEVPLEDSSRTAWVLKVDVDKDLVTSGSGAQWFAGSFDGFQFDPLPSKRAVQLADYGHDFYAAQTWSDLPEGTPNPIWIAWMSNHQSGKEYPTHPWRGAMTLPRQLFLREHGEELILCQRPLSPFVGAGATPRELGSLLLSGAKEQCLDEGHEPLIGEVAFTVGRQSRGTLIFSVTGNHDSGVRAEFDLNSGELRLWREVHPAITATEFRNAVSAPIAVGEDLKVQVLLDRSSVEIFLNDGSAVVTACYFAVGTARTAVATTLGSQVQLDGLVVTHV